MKPDERHGKLVLMIANGRWYDTCSYENAFSTELMDSKDCVFLFVDVTCSQK